MENQNSCPTCGLKDICWYKDMIIDQASVQLSKENMEGLLSDIEDNVQKTGCNFQEELDETIQEVKDLYDIH